MHSHARVMQPPGFLAKDPWIWGQRPRRANDTMATALVWRGFGRPRRQDGSPGGQKPYRRSPGRVDLSAGEVRRGAVPAREVVSLALRPRGLLAGLSRLTAVGCRRGARIPRRGEVVRPVRPQPRGPRGARPPDLQLAHRVAKISLSLASKTPKG